MKIDLQLCQVESEIFDMNYEQFLGTIHYVLHCVDDEKEIILKAG